MIALQVVKDRFPSSQQQGSRVVTTSGMSDKPFIRRPTRGIVLKDETFATLRLVAGVGGANQLLVDAGSRRKDANGPLEVDGKRATDIYSNFLLQQVQEERMEKQQILETFGEPYIFLFGERARVISFQGVLINSGDFNWEAEWWYNYDNYLRGTRAVENDARVFLSYDHTLVSGYIIGSAATKNVMEPNHVSFQFQLFITSYNSFTDLGNPNALPGFPLDAQHPKFEGALDVKDRVVSDAAAAQYRPVLLPFEISTQDGKGIGAPPSTLDAGFENAVAQVEGAWSKASSIVNNALSTVSQWMNGDTVRVPVGFAGALEFDIDDGKAHLTSADYGLSVKYSTYSDNDDEYVGVGDHYGSAIQRPAFLALQGYEDLSTKLADASVIVADATTQWKAHGLVPDDSTLGPVAKAIAGKALGLVGVGATSLLRKADTSTTPGTANSPLGRGLHAAILPE